MAIGHLRPAATWDFYNVTKLASATGNFLPRQKIQYDNYADDFFSYFYNLSKLDSSRNMNPCLIGYQNASTNQESKRCFISRHKTSQLPVPNSYLRTFQLINSINFDQNLLWQGKTLQLARLSKHAMSYMIYFYV